MAELWSGAAVMKLVVDAQSDAMTGIVSLYNHSSRADTAYMAAVAHPDFAGTGVVAEGIACLCDYGFRILGLRKIYAECLGFNVSQFRILERIAEEEARLRDHERHQGKYWDLITYAVYRDAWEKMLDDPLATLAVGR
jgi:RimJ/RimL family protein N-acetyltransferase